jgi:hypothetical protein
MEESPCGQRKRRHANLTPRRRCNRLRPPGSCQKPGQLSTTRQIERWGSASGGRSQQRNYRYRGATVDRPLSTPEDAVEGQSALRSSPDPPQWERPCCTDGRPAGEAPSRTRVLSRHKSKIVRFLQKRAGARALELLCPCLRPLSSLLCSLSAAFKPVDAGIAVGATQEATREAGLCGGHYDGMSLPGTPLPVTLLSGSHSQFTAHALPWMVAQAQPPFLLASPQWPGSLRPVGLVWPSRTSCRSSWLIPAGISTDRRSVPHFDTYSFQVSLFVTV